MGDEKSTKICWSDQSYLVDLISDGGVLGNWVEGIGLFYGWVLNHLELSSRLCHKTFRNWRVGSERLRNLTRRAGLVKFLNWWRILLYSRENSVVVIDLTRPDQSSPTPCCWAVSCDEQQLLDILSVEPTVKPWEVRWVRMTIKLHTVAWFLKASPSLVVIAEAQFNHKTLTILASIARWQIKLW